MSVIYELGVKKESRMMSVFQIWLLSGAVTPQISSRGWWATLDREIDALNVSHNASEVPVSHHYEKANMKESLTFERMVKARYVDFVMGAKIMRANTII